MCAVPNMAVLCSPLISCCPGMLLGYCLNDLQTVPVAPIVIGIVLAFTIHMRWIAVLRSTYFKISLSFLITFLPPEIATSSNMYIRLSLSRIMMCGLLLGTLLSVRTCWFHNTVTLPSLFVSTDCGTLSYQCLSSNFNDDDNNNNNNYYYSYNLLLLLLLLSLSSSSSSSLSSSSSPLCRVYLHILPRQTMSLGDILLQLFCLCCLWCLYV